MGEISERILRKNSDLQSLLPLTISAQDGLVDQTIYFNKQVASKQLKNYLLLYNGDFAYNKSYSVGYPYGTIKRLDKYKQGVLSTLYIAFKPTNINSDFLQHYYDTDKWYREIYRNAAEGARNHGLLNISANDFFNSKLITPSDNDEQLKIAKIINVFNRLITLQQRKLEILIKLKQSFLTKSMVNNLDKNPELYFNSASIKCLKQKLSNLTIKEFKGNTKLNDTKPGKTEYLDAERLNGNAPLFIDKPINTLKSDILILWDGSKAGSVYYGFEGSLGSTLKAIRLNPKLVNSFFVYQQLKSKQDVIFNKYRTPNIPHVIKNFTKVYSIYFPSMAVQNKIARFLGNLDTLIEIQQKSIKDHKVIKKYLLQKLFI
ncbi:restriction endonuclease subunit S [Lactobacillus reuteri]|uniref:Restriction endonuclease subunit S n=1 Tax=Limosilactobacillus reuteri TaxID=1598 RepID=A0A6L5P711_LIMRT|nr:restriction endonuclease subunit S [Limosilactobacillus reuteri]MRH09462.1 restriction endonuclease subunit S [Limosilactobacillus reuteri]